jgi:putative ABC transport system substrate-binding protein
MIDRIVLTFCLGVLLAPVSTSEAQQTKKIARLGYVSASGGPGTPDARFEVFRQGLRDLGYIEGKNILLEVRYAEGKQDRFPSLVADLVELKVDVLLLTTLPGIRAAKQATKTIPIVIITAQDPVTIGIVDSLADPGGNVTGLTRLTRELSGKRLELLKEVIPDMSRVGVLWDEEGIGSGIAFKEYEAAARALKIQLQSLQVGGPNPDLEGAFETAAKGRANALINVRSPMLNRYQKRLAGLAIKRRLPSMCEGSDDAEAGCLVSYSSNDTENFRRAAYYVDRILKGTKPADLPVEQPPKFELVINLKTAKEIGVIIPQKVLARADKVIR